MSTTGTGTKTQRTVSTCSMCSDSEGQQAYRSPGRSPQRRRTFSGSEWIPYAVGNAEGAERPGIPTARAAPEGGDSRPTSNARDATGKSTFRPSMRDAFASTVLDSLPALFVAWRKRTACWCVLWRPSVRQRQGDRSMRILRASDELHLRHCEERQEISSAESLPTTTADSPSLR